MPMYEYQCQQCGHQFEVRQKFSDPPVASCIQCQGPVEKLISHTGFQLKGSGWFQQGYGAKKEAAAPACASADSGGGCAGCPKAANG